jgi:nucleotide-binding universal stress UspA family protein
MRSEMNTTIVVGVDSSPQALVAARKAADIAKALGAELHIVTAVMKNEFHELGIGSDHTVVSDIDLAEQDLRAIAAEFRSTIAVSTKALRSSPAEALCSEADRLNASMVVVGNKRVQGMARVLGSVAGAVAKDAPCDVYIVHTYD